MQAQLWTLSGLAVELGRDRRAVAKALEGLEPDSEETDSAGRVTRSWRMARVFAHLTGSGEKGERLDGNAERARKDKEAADKLALENAVTRGELGRISDVVEWFGGHVDRCRARLLQVPDAIGQFCDARNAAVVVAEVRRLLYQALSELAADAPASGLAAPAAVGASADTDGQPVGGSGAPPLKRGKRGARPVAN